VGIKGVTTGTVLQIRWGLVVVVGNVRGGVEIVFVVVKHNLYVARRMEPMA
jgi:hypothetical protein